MLAVATIVTAWSGSIEAFAVWRLLTGLALGACLPNVTALVSELAPKRRRASMLVAVSCGISVGAVLAGLIVPWIVAWGGWPAIFTVCGGFTVLLAAALWYGLPESPRLLLERGDAGALERLTRRLKLDPASEDAPALPVAAMPAPRPSLLAPLTRHFRVATAVFVGLVTINAFNLYLLVSWLPTLLPEAGFTIDQAARLTAVVQFGGLAGGLLLSWFIDRSSTVKTLLVSYGLVILALLGFSLLPPTMIGWGGLLLIVGAGVAGGSLAIIAVGTSFYPPQLLSSALGIAIAVARLGAIAGPLGGGWLMARSAAPPTFMLVAIVPAAICAALVLLIPAARRRTDAGR
jgi:AAHS family 4-hydroxybenzoate transporter-like MFS transporter